MAFAATAAAGVIRLVNTTGTSSGAASAGSAASSGAASAGSTGATGSAGVIPHINPSSTLPGTHALMSVVSGVFEVALILCLAGLVVGALVWAVSGKGANIRGSHAGRDIVIGSLIGAFLAGGGWQLINWAFGLGGGIH
jgi:hypothetical protein